MADSVITNRSFSDSALLGTFLVSTGELLEAAFAENIHGNIRDNIGSVVLLSNGYTCEQLEPFASSLGCKVIVVLTYGVIGWSAESKDNVEYEERGRGGELGLPGSKNALPGITVVALKKQNESERCPLLTTDDEATPTIADGAAVHVVMTPFSDQPAAEKVIFSDKHAACMGGYCKEIYELSANAWERRTLATITIMKSEKLMVNLFNSYGAYEENPKLAINTEGKIVAETLPAGYLPIFVASYQCYCRGTNLFPTTDMEARGLEALFGADLPTFGMFCAGEIGNDYEINPTGWNKEYTANQVTCLHSCNTIVCVVAERVDDNATIPADLQTRQTAMADYMRQLAEAEKTPEPQADSSNLIQYVPPVPATGEPPNYLDFQRGMGFMDAAVPNYNGVSFWTHPGGWNGPERYAKSEPCEKVDFFVSHVLRADPNSPSKMMKTPIVYAIQKATDIFIGSHSAVTRLVAEGKVKAEDAFSYMCERKYWTDIGCVDQVDIAKKIYIITHHLGDFVQNARFVLCVVSTHYFTRAWCFYEFSICLKRDNLDSIVVANAGVTWFESERRTVADCIVNCSLESSSCFDQADRKIIDAKINEEFVSVAHFNRLVKFAACALTARASLFFGVDFYESWYTIWADTAKRCGFDGLAAVLSSVDLATLKKEAHALHPDEPGVSHARERLTFVEHFTATWFAENVAPLLDAERRAAIKGLAGKEEVPKTEPACGCFCS